MTRVSVQSGDITQVEADGLITAINSGGMWFGGIDSAIQRCAGEMLHGRVADRMPLTEGQVIFVPATAGSHSGKFASALFVVDDLERPLRHIVAAALQAAEQRQLAKITLPTIRTDVMLGIYEKTTQDALNELVLAIKEFISSSPSHVNEITVVVYDDHSSEQFLRDALQVE